MKNISKAIFALAALALVGSSVARADYYRDPNYRYGHNGYWDHGNRYHHWDRYHNHDGYWSNRNGVRVFIDI